MLKKKRIVLDRKSLQNRKARILAGSIRGARVGRTSGLINLRTPFPEPADIWSIFSGSFKTHGTYKQLAKVIHEDPKLFDEIKHYKFVLVDIKGNIVATNKGKFLDIFGRKRLKTSKLNQYQTKVPSTEKLYGQAIRTTRVARTAGIWYIPTIVGFWGLLRGTQLTRHYYRQLAKYIKTSGNPKLIEARQKYRYVLVDVNGNPVFTNKQRMLKLFGRRREIIQ